jgi:hypothetical protein
MTSEEERLKRRKRRQDHIVKDLHSPKYHQRKLPRKRKGGRHDRQTDEDLHMDDGDLRHSMDDDFDWD